MMKNIFYLTGVFIFVANCMQASSPTTQTPYTGTTGVPPTTAQASPLFNPVSDQTINQQSGTTFTQQIDTQPIHQDPIFNPGVRNPVLGPGGQVYSGSEDVTPGAQGVISNLGTQRIGIPGQSTATGQAQTTVDSLGRVVQPIPQQQQTGTSPRAITPLTQPQQKVSAAEIENNPTLDNVQKAQYFFDAANTQKNLLESYKIQGLDSSRIEVKNAQTLYEEALQKYNLYQSLQNK